MLTNYVVVTSSSSLICITFFYDINYEDLQDIGDLHHWTKDDVQTARVLFYLRVIPTFVSIIPASLFAQKVASTTFLYPFSPLMKLCHASLSNTFKPQKKAYDP
jgi:hypothetical protein